MGIVRFQSRRPTFFWQGLLIVLPVIVLAGVSLWSVRQDELVAQAEARRNAAASLTVVRAACNEASRQLAEYLAVQEAWAGNGETGTEPGAGSPELRHWERGHPSLNWKEGFVPSAWISTDGREQRPQYSSVPLPPAWFCELTASQRRAWQTLLQARTASSVADRWAGSFKAFEQTRPGPEALKAACSLTNTALVNLDQAAEVVSETGIGYRELACYELLHSRRPLDSRLVTALRQLVLQKGIFGAEPLLELAEAKTNHAEAALRQQVQELRQRWEAQNRVCEWVDALRRQGMVAPNKPLRAATFWVSGDSGWALVFAEPASEPGFVPGRSGFRLRFVSESAVRRLFALPGGQDAPWLPAYAGLSIELAGFSLLPPMPANNPILASSTVVLSAGSYGQFPARVVLSLAHPDILLAEQRYQAWRLAGLILTAAFAAVVGLIAAYRAFRNQIRLNELKGNFVSSVSHELRAPIASVRLMAESLERGKITAPDKQREYFHFIGQECRRLSSLIANVLDFSRIEQGRKLYEFEPTDVAALVHQTVEIMQVYAAEQGVTIEVQIRAQGLVQAVTGSLQLLADGKALQQALINLIDNALKHSQKGQIVTVGVDPANSEASKSSSPSSLRLWVEDQGPGIPACEQEKIFERFYRLGSELRRETPGVGIGLSIVKHAVESHGGRVWVQSEVGRGSRFWIELPLKPVTAASGLTRVK